MLWKEKKMLKELEMGGKVFQPRLAPRFKIFTAGDIAEAEMMVNEWLEQHPVKIQHMGQSQCERGGKFLFTITLAYYKI